MAPARPLTHDLFKDVLEAVGQELTEVRITDLREGVFYAELVFASGVEVSARPSDAIALALRTGTPIYGSDGVLDDAGIAIPDEQEDEVEKFREFLDQISPRTSAPAVSEAAAADPADQWSVTGRPCPVVTEMLAFATGA